MVSKKRFLSFFLAFSLLTALLPQALAVSRTAVESAGALYTLGLFKGTGTQPDGTPVYELARTPTRAEAVVMLVRLLGREDEVRGGRWPQPFTDVEDWAAPYVGYAYSAGLTQGTSPTAFGSEEAVSAAQYLTFVLRALHYSDSAGDFSWEGAAAFADRIGLTAGEYAGGAPFTRGDAAKVSCQALGCALKGTQTTLLQSLLDAGAVTGDAVEKAGLSSALDARALPAPPAGALTAEQVYQRCSPAVFYIEVFDAGRRLLGTGSGFFIDADGRAVTNYHVIDGASYATITLADGHTAYPVSGVLGYDAAQDIAILKVGGSGFPYLTAGDAAGVVGGATVYAIGSPLGMSNTISQGIISNGNRVVDGTRYIQTDAAISSGSSGGALLNTAGQVIGITSATVRNGQSLNLAVPFSAVSGLRQGASPTPLAQLAAAQADIPAAIAAAQPTLTLQAGQSRAVTVTQNRSAGDLSVYFEVEDPSVASAAWGEWQDAYSLPLTITGRAAGTTHIALALLGGDGDVLATGMMTVTVTGNAAAGDGAARYAELPAVPDFGAMAGAPLVYKDTPLDPLTYLVAYTYPADSVSSTLLDRYCRALEGAGFTYLDGFEDSDGFPILVYVNPASQLEVFLGHTRLSGTVYWNIMVCRYP